jgi:hypothetical protein
MTSRNPDGTEDFPSPVTPTSPTARFAQHQPAEAIRHLARGHLVLDEGWPAWPAIIRTKLRQYAMAWTADDNYV